MRKLSLILTCVLLACVGAVAQRPVYAPAGNSGAPGPGVDVKFVPAAVCNGGQAFSAGLSTYDNQQPQPGCINSSTSAAAYMAFQAAAAQPQYATATFATPPYWTGSDLLIDFAAATTSGNVAWILESGCTNATGDLSAITWAAPVTITTAVSSTALGLVQTAVTTSFVAPGANGCAVGSLVTYRLHRAQASPDTATGDAYLLGVVLTTHRSQ